MNVPPNADTVAATIGDDDRSVLAEALRRLGRESTSDESMVHSSHSDHSSNAW